MNGEAHIEGSTIGVVVVGIVVVGNAVVGLSVGTDVEFVTCVFVVVSPELDSIPVVSSAVLGAVVIRGVFDGTVVVMFESSTSAPEPEAVSFIGEVIGGAVGSAV